MMFLRKVSFQRRLWGLVLVFAKRLEAMELMREEFFECTSFTKSNNSFFASLRIRGSFMRNFSAMQKKFLKRSIYLLELSIFAPEILVLLLQKSTILRLGLLVKE